MEHGAAAQMLSSWNSLQHTQSGPRWTPLCALLPNSPCANPRNGKAESWLTPHHGGSRGEEDILQDSLKTQGAWWLMGGEEVSDVRIVQEWSQFMEKLALGFHGCRRLIKDRNVHKPHEIFILRGRAYQVSAPGLESKVLGFQTSASVSVICCVTLGKSMYLSEQEYGTWF